MDTLLIIIAMLLLAVIAEPLARLLRLPFSALLVLIGFAGSELLVANGIDTGLRWQQFNYLILHVFVPILVFESAFNMKARVLLKNLLPVLLLAIPLARGSTCLATSGDTLTCLARSGNGDSSCGSCFCNIAMRSSETEFAPLRWESQEFWRFSRLAGAGDFARVGGSVRGLPQRRHWSA